jgi:ferredoxin/flavodoxin---NADP+ reductase
MTLPLVDPARKPLVPLAPRGALGPLPGAVVEPRPVRRREFAANATLVYRVDLTPMVSQFVVRPDTVIADFKPGQYFALGLEVGGELLQRPYSTSSPAGTTDEVEFLIRRVATGTFTPRLWDLGVGARVWLGPPKGLFTLQPGDERTHLFVSTGTGLAPFIAMAESLLRTEGGPRIVLVHGVSYAAELAYRDRIAAWSAYGRLSYVPTVSRPTDVANAGWLGAMGRTEAILDRVCEEQSIDPATTVAYICGNPDMIQVATEVLRGRGLPDSAIIRELYWTAAGPGK